MTTTTPTGRDAADPDATAGREDGTAWAAPGDPAALAPGPGGAEEEPVHLAPAAATPEIPDAPLRGNRDFWVVLVGQGVSSFGDAITNTALPILVLALTGSGFAMGVVGVLSTLPDLVLGLPAGAYADRWDRRKMMFVADLGRAILTALIPISVALDGPTLALILLVTFPLNVLRVLWLAAFTAAVPGLVGRGQIARANAIFEAFFNIGWIVGPALAGFLAATIGPGPTIAIDALTFALSAGALLFVRRSLRPAARSEPTHLLADIREGIAFVARQPTLRAVIAFWTTTSVLYAGLTSGLIFYITIDRDLGSDVVGFVLSAFAVGSLGGSLVAARMAFRAVGSVMLVGSVVMGLTLVVVALDVPVPVLVASAFVAGILNANVLVSYLTLRTQLSPDALLGRVGATARTLSVGMMPIGALLAGALLDAIGGAATLSLMGAGSIVAGLGFALVPTVRHARVARRGAPA
ncbi:MAG: MFS transporter [Chloroflexi bacterium]|nr:MFS transporter [Chloroflexota bacterium]